MKLSWDGSYLGEIEKIVLLNKNFKIQTKNVLTWEIKIDSNIYTVISIKTNSFVQCFTDMLKPTFELNSNGTHSLLHKNNIYTIVKLDKTIYKLKQLENIDINSFDESYKYKIRKIFLFREMIGMSPNNNSSILIDLNMKIDPISIYENVNKIYLNDLNVYLSKNIIDKYFVKTSIDVFCVEICRKNYKDENISFIINDLRTKIYNIIKNIDKDKAYISGLITNRINRNFMINT